MTPKEDSKYYIIAGDIGGTNSRIALYVASAFIGSDLIEPIDVHRRVKPTVLKKYLNEEYVKKFGGLAFQKILNDFLTDANLASHGINMIISACFACAGPVKKNSCKFSNNAFTINGDDIQNCEEGYLKSIKVRLTDEISRTAAASI